MPVAVSLLLTLLALLPADDLFGQELPMSDSRDLSPVAIVIHGGAGTIRREKMSAEMEARYRETLQLAVTAGYDLLQAGGTSRDAVKAAIVILEDSELFNAGHGAVLNHVGDVELDASIMEGHTLNAGAVASLRHTRNPILLADRVLTDSPHVMLIGEGAEEFARHQGFEAVDNSYFKTERRIEQLKKAKDRITLSEDISDDIQKPDDFEKPIGTVGAVALDRHGHITAGTSTGGMTNKRFGRVGDSPIIGAGTYADDQCGVSATGHGEYFIRAAVAHDICARVRYQGVSLLQAADEVVMHKLVDMQADGGVIALDRNGDVTTPFNSVGMYRASIDREGKLSVGIFR